MNKIQWILLIIIMINYSLNICRRDLLKDIKYIEVDSHLHKFYDGQYPIPNGMSYNSYIILDEKIIIIDTVKEEFFINWINDIKNILKGIAPDYLLILHIEPKSKESINELIKIYPNIKIMASSNCFNLMKNFFNTDYSERKIILKDEDIISLGTHELQIFEAPKIKWPDIILAYDKKSQFLFSSILFGQFGANDIQNFSLDEFRRYYVCNLANYGPNIESLLQKIEKLTIKMICPENGIVINIELKDALNLYNKWSKYIPEEEGVVIVYGSIYEHTLQAVKKIEAVLKSIGIPVVLFDVNGINSSYMGSQAFKYSKLIIATITYHTKIYPLSRMFIRFLSKRNFQNRIIGLIENGSFFPMIIDQMKNSLQNKNIHFISNSVSILCALNETSNNQLDMFINELIKDNNKFRFNYKLIIYISIFFAFIFAIISLIICKKKKKKYYNLYEINNKKYLENKITKNSEIINSKINNNKSSLKILN